MPKHIGHLPPLAPISIGAYTHRASAPLAPISIGAYTHRASARAMYETSEGTKYKTRAEALYKKAPIDIGASKEVWLFISK